VSVWLVCLCGFAFAAATARAAEVVIPARIPLQGFLTDAAGTPINGTVTVQFRLYELASGGAALWNETQNVNAVNGVFNAMLGDVTPLGADVFKALPVYYVGINFNGDELSPRLRFGSVPYAVHAGDGVPRGAVMSFDLTTCPAGWTEYTPARGRVIVGLPNGGVLAGTAGTALTNLELRSHTHSAAVTFDGAHSHSVDPAAVTSASTSVAHTHFIDPPLQITNFHTHGHEWSTWAPGNQSRWTTFDAAGDSKTINSWSSGVFPVSGGPFIPIAKGPPIAEPMFTSQETHNHSIDIAGFTSGSASVTHSHSVDVPATATTSAGSHTHGVSLGNAQDGTPYVQLLTCKKS
jgi:hypothetical protein